MLWNDIYLLSCAGWLPPRLNGHPGGEFTTYTQAADSDTSVILATRSAQTAISLCADPTPLEWILYASTLAETHLTPAAYLQRAIGAEQATAFKLDCASNGGVLSLAVAASLLSSLPAPSSPTALVSTGFAFDKNLDRFETMPGTIFSDGSASAVLGRRNGIARLVATTYSAAPQLESYTSSYAIVSNRPNDTDIIEGQQYPAGYYQLQRHKSAQAATQILQETDLTIDDIAMTAVPGFPYNYIEYTITDTLGIPPERTTIEFMRTVGHAGPCDQLLGLDYALKSRRVGPGDHILLAGVGSGFTWTYALIQVL
ncbi:ketoacyl-ACP synthase III family protein [Mycobacteroides abscessus]